MKKGVKKAVTSLLLLGFVTILLSSCYRHRVCATYVKDDVQKVKHEDINEKI